MSHYGLMDTAKGARLLASLVTGLAVLLIFTPSVFAGTADVTAAGGLSYDADADASPNDVRLYTSSGGYTITDEAGLIAGSGCVAASSTQVECSPTTSQAEVRLGVGNDVFYNQVHNAPVLTTTVHGGEGADELSGGGGEDTLLGENDNDAIAGYGADDVLDGGAGDDNLDGGAEDDALEGGTGSDTLSGSGGTDAVSYTDRPSAILVILDDLGGDGQLGEADNVRSDVETITGTGFDDVIAGPAPGSDSPDQTFVGGAGDDTLSGGDGLDSLYGQDGDDDLDGGGDGDILYPGFGTDVVSGGGSNFDWVRYDGNASVQEPERTDDLTITLDDLPNDAGEGDNILSDIEQVSGGGGDDDITGNAADTTSYGNDGNDVIRGLGGNDRAFGHRGDDVLEGGDGNDSLWGDEQPIQPGGVYQPWGGNDTLDGGGGTDFLEAGAGHDQLYAEDGVTQEDVYCGPGTDTGDADNDGEEYTDDLTACEFSALGVPANLAPTANAIASEDESDTSGRTFELDGSLSVDPDSASPLTYVWRFKGQVIGSEAVIAHRFPREPGIYRARLTVTDEDGASDTAFVDVLVTEQEQEPQPPSDITTPSDLLFRHGRCDLTDRGRRYLQKVKREAKGARKMRVEGHASSPGTDAYNLRLSKCRAKRVKRWFAEHMDKKDRPEFVVAWYGERRPVATNSTRRGQAKNRRVEMAIWR